MNKKGIFVLWVHDQQFSKEELVINAEYFPKLKVMDVLEIYSPSNPTKKLCLRVKQLSPIVPKSKLQISISKYVASVFDFALRKEVVVNIIPEKQALIDFVELSFKDQYIGRSDMWRLKLNLQNECVYVLKKLAFAQIRAQVEEMVSNGQKVSSGLIDESTKFVFRSRSAKFVLFIQMSKEMWDYSSDGELYFEKAVNGFLKNLFQRWKSLSVNHTITIILFSRTFHDNDDILDEVPNVPRNPQGKLYQDFYKVVVNEETRPDWNTIIVNLKREFNDYHTSVNWDIYGRNSALGKNSTASQGNFLEAINLGMSYFDKHYIDRDFTRTGQMIVVISAGTGIFEVDQDINLITKQRMIDNGIGCDLICLNNHPLHVVPLFKYSNNIVGNGSNNKIKNTSLQYNFPYWLAISFYDENINTNTSNNNNNNNNNNNSNNDTTTIITTTTTITTVTTRTFMPQFKIPEKTNSFYSYDTDEKPVYDFYIPKDPRNLPAFTTPKINHKYTSNSLGVNSYEDTIFNILPNGNNNGNGGNGNGGGNIGGTNDLDSMDNSILDEYVAHSDTEPSDFSDTEDNVSTTPVQSNLAIHYNNIKNNNNNNNRKSTIQIGGTRSSSSFDNQRTTPSTISKNRSTIQPIGTRYNNGNVNHSNRPISPSNSFDHKSHQLHHNNNNNHQYHHNNNHQHNQIQPQPQNNVTTQLFLKKKKEINPFTYDSTPFHLTSNRRRWSHLWFSPNTYIFGKTNTNPNPFLPNWKSLCEPASLPITTDYFPSQKDLKAKYREYVHNLTLSPDDNEYLNNFEALLKELISQRLAQGYQLIMITSEPSVPATSSGSNSTNTGAAPSTPQSSLPALSSSPPSGNNSSLTTNPTGSSSRGNKKSYQLSLGHDFHSITYDPSNLSIQVKRYQRHNGRSVSKTLKYHYFLNTIHLSGFLHNSIELQHTASSEYPWNSLDNLICGTIQGFKQNIKYWRVLYAIIPTVENSQNQSLLLQQQQLDDEKEKEKEKEKLILEKKKQQQIQKEDSSTLLSTSSSTVVATTTTTTAIATDDRSNQTTAVATTTITTEDSLISATLNSSSIPIPSSLTSPLQSPNLSPSIQSTTLISTTTNSTTTSLSTTNSSATTASTTAAITQPPPTTTTLLNGNHLIGSQSAPTSPLNSHRNHSGSGSGSNGINSNIINSSSSTNIALSNFNMKSPPLPGYPSSTSLLSSTTSPTTNNITTSSDLLPSSISTTPTSSSNTVGGLNTLNTSNSGENNINNVNNQPEHTEEERILAFNKFREYINSQINRNQAQAGNQTTTTSSLSSSNNNNSNNNSNNNNNNNTSSGSTILQKLDIRSILFSSIETVDPLMMNSSSNNSGSDKNSNSFNGFNNGIPSQEQIDLFKEKLYPSNIAGIYYRLNMPHPIGIKMVERKYGIRRTSYKKCFTGTDGVDWMLQNIEITRREEAVTIFQLMMDSKLIKQVDKSTFIDGQIYYRLKEDDLFISPPILKSNNNNNSNNNSNNNNSNNNNHIKSSIDPHSLSTSQQPSTSSSTLNSPGKDNTPDHDHSPISSPKQTGNKLSSNPPLSSSSSSTLNTTNNNLTSSSSTTNTTSSKQQQQSQSNTINPISSLSSLINNPSLRQSNTDYLNLTNSSIINNKEKEILDDKDNNSTQQQNNNNNGGVGDSTDQSSNSGQGSLNSTLSSIPPTPSNPLHFSGGISFGGTSLQQQSQPTTTSHFHHSTHPHQQQQTQSSQPNNLLDYYENPNRINEVKIEMDLSKTDRFEWVMMKYDKTFCPTRYFHIEFNWIVSTGCVVDDFLNSCVRKAKQFGLNLIQIPMEKNYSPFSLPTHVALDQKLMSPQVLKHIFTKFNLIPDTIRKRSSSLVTRQDLYMFNDSDVQYTEYIHRTGMLFVRVVDDGFLCYINNAPSNKQYLPAATMCLDSFQNLCTQLNNSISFIGSNNSYNNNNNNNNSNNSNSTANSLKPIDPQEANFLSLLAMGYKQNNSDVDEENQDITDDNSNNSDIDENDENDEDESENDEKKNDWEAQNEAVYYSVMSRSPLGF